MKSLFEQLIDDIDAAIVDVTLSELPKGEKSKKLRMLITARDYQLHTASIMDRIYPESVLCAASNSPAECKSMGCVNVVHCEGKALKRLRIEGRIIRDLDESPGVEEDPVHRACDRNCEGCGLPIGRIVITRERPAQDKIDPRKEIRRWPEF